jgi:hypothetical protein
MSHQCPAQAMFLKICLFIYLFAVLRFELRASTLSHSTSPFFVMGFFKIGSHKLFAQLASNYDPPDLCLLSN